MATLLKTRPKPPSTKPSKRRSKSTPKAATLKPVLTAKLIRIGNSRGVRLPKALIEQAELSDEIELVVGDREVIVRSKRDPRAGWGEAFRKAFAKLGPDALEKEREEWADWQNISNDFDAKGWDW